VAVVAGVLCVLALIVGLAGPSRAAGPAGRGPTTPVYPYADAVRQKVWVEAPMDSDHDGRRDRIAVYLIRPAGAPKVPVILQATPYLTADTAPTFPEWYDEYFVPRGYAFAEVAVQGTAESEGCPTTGGRPDTLSVEAAIRWLTGRAAGYDAAGDRVTAGWSTGRVGMVGLSYDGTLAIAAAADGVPGLTTIVPMSAISNWYDYARDQGIPYNGAWGDRYPEYQADRVISPTARPHCADVLAALGDGAGDDTGDYTPFWAERNYRARATHVRASVFAVQGLTDPKVKGREFAAWWAELAREHVPRKLWLHADGHVDPVTVRPDVWQETLHQWFDHWLYGVDNGVTGAPPVDVQRPDLSWETHRDWPEPGTRDTRLWFGPGTLAGTPAPRGPAESFTDDPAQREATMIAAPTTTAPHRLAYLTAPLAAPLRVSGTPRVSVAVAADQPSTPLTALLVDYGPEAGSEAEAAAPADKGGGPGGVLPIVTRGAIDAKNRDSLRSERPLLPGRRYQIGWDLHATDHVFAAGHRIGLVLVANDTDYTTADPVSAGLAVTLATSALTLPVAPSR
jgi:X-Pro dipeptidyl-peptidase